MRTQGETPREEQAPPWTSSLQNCEQVNPCLLFEQPGRGCAAGPVGTEVDVPTGMEGGLTADSRAPGQGGLPSEPPLCHRGHLHPFPWGPCSLQAGASPGERLPAGWNPNRQAAPRRLPQGQRAEMRERICVAPADVCLHFEGKVGIGEEGSRAFHVKAVWANPEVGEPGTPNQKVPCVWIMRDRDPRNNVLFTRRAPGRTVAETADPGPPLMGTLLPGSGRTPEFPSSSLVSDRSGYFPRVCLTRHLP